MRVRRDPEDQFERGTEDARVSVEVGVRLRRSAEASAATACVATIVVVAFTRPKTDLGSRTMDPFPASAANRATTAISTFPSLRISTSQDARKPWRTPFVTAAVTATWGPTTNGSAMWRTLPLGHVASNVKLMSSEAGLCGSRT